MQEIEQDIWHVKKPRSKWTKNLHTIRRISKVASHLCTDLSHFIIIQWIISVWIVFCPFQDQWTTIKMCTMSQNIKSTLKVNRQWSVHVHDIWSLLTLASSLVTKSTKPNPRKDEVPLNFLGRRTDLICPYTLLWIEINFSRLLKDHCLHLVNITWKFFEYLWL